MKHRRSSRRPAVPPPAAARDRSAVEPRAADFTPAAKGPAPPDPLPAAAEPAPQAPQETVVITGLSVLTARVFRVLLGPVFLLFLLRAVFEARTWLSGSDVVYALVAALALFCRWVEQRSGQAMTVEGKPATGAEFRSYLIVFPLVVAAAWLLTKIASFLFS